MVGFSTAGLGCGVVTSISANCVPQPIVYGIAFCGLLITVTFTFLLIISGIGVVIINFPDGYIGNKGKQKPGARGWSHKEKVLSLVERKGQVRSRHVPAVNAETLRPILMEQIAAESRLVTDEARVYILLAIIGLALWKMLEMGHFHTRVDQPC